MDGWAIAFGILTVLTAGGGVTAWFYIRPTIRKHRAETHKAVVEAAVAEGAADDEHLKTIVGYVVEPLKERVDDLEQEVSRLRDEVRTTRKKYFRLVDWARDVRAWVRLWYPDAQPPLPSLPAEVIDDL